MISKARGEEKCSAEEWREAEQVRNGLYNVVDRGLSVYRDEDARLCAGMGKRYRIDAGRAEWAVVRRASKGFRF